MAVGLSCGMGQIWFAIILTVIGCLLLLLLNKVNIFEKEKGEKKLKILIPENLEYDTVFEDIFNECTNKDGVININESTEVGKSMASNPRTAIGIIDENHYVFVVSDGRTSESKGLSLYELTTFMKEYGVKTLYNLDGGGSSTMYFNAEVINNPTINGKKITERSVSDIVYIGY